MKTCCLALLELAQSHRQIRHSILRYRKVLKASLKAEAQKEATDLWRLITTPLIKEPAETVILLSDALEAHRGRADISPWTVRLEAACARNLTKHLGKETTIAQVTTAAVERYKKERGGAVAPRTCNMDLQVLKACLNWLVEMGYIQAVPCRIRKLPESRRRFMALTAIRQTPCWTNARESFTTSWPVCPPLGFGAASFTR